MVWKCENCGFDANPDTELKCEGCGTGNAVILVLTAEATGKSIEMRIATVVGRQLLKNFAGDEYRFASEVQFRFFRDKFSGDWIVTHEEGAANPTYLNGEPLTGESLVSDGSVLTIGTEKLPLTLRLKT